MRNIFILFIIFIFVSVNGYSFTNTLITNGTLLIGITELEDFDENWATLDFDSGKILFSSRKKGAKLLGDLYWDNCDKGIFIGGVNHLKGNIIDMGAIDFNKLKNAPTTGYIRSVPLKVGNVYCFITEQNNYAKIKVISMNKSKTKIILKWTFQRNGTNQF